MELVESESYLRAPRTRFRQRQKGKKASDAIEAKKTGSTMTTAASLLLRAAGRKSVASWTAIRFSSVASRATVSRANSIVHDLNNSVKNNAAIAKRGMSSNSSSTRLMSAGDALKKLAEANPHLDVIRYEHKNDKWTLKRVEYHSDALATGFLDTGLLPGDVVLSWLPLHFVELHILQFACSKAGFVLYNLDPSQAITDPEGAKASLAKALEITEANVLVSQEAGNDVNYVNLVKAVVPETRFFDFGEGMPFFSPRFPHLRFPIHTGFDNEGKWGMLPLKHMIVPSQNLSDLLRDAGVEKPTGKTPLMGELIMGKDGLPQKGKILTNEEVFKSGVWPEFNSILKKEYREVEGVGVIF